MTPQFKGKWNSEKLPLNELIFNRGKYCDEDHKACKQILKEGEDKDIENNEGMYFMSSKFNLVMVNNMANEFCDDEVI